VFVSFLLTVGSVCRTRTHAQQKREGSPSSGRPFQYLLFGVYDKSLFAARGGGEAFCVLSVWSSSSSSRRPLVHSSTRLVAWSSFEPTSRNRARRKGPVLSHPRCKMLLLPVARIISSPFAWSDVAEGGRVGHRRERQQRLVGRSNDPIRSIQGHQKKVIYTITSQKSKCAPNERFGAL
jgi:hypothetical protein